MRDFTSILSDIFDRRAEARLDLDEERQTLAEAQAGDERAKMRLLLAYAPALRNAVATYSRAEIDGASSASLEDVRAQAVLGLLEAIERWDGDVHERLAALAPQYIRDAVSSNSAAASSFTIPERTMKRFWGIVRAAGGNVYEAAALAPSYEMKSETFLSILSAVREVDSYSVDDPDGAPSGAAYRVASPAAAQAIADAEDRILVEAAFRAVTTTEADVVRLAYGFSDYEPVPDVEIAHRLGTSRPTVQRTRTAALGKMRDALGVA